MRLAMSKKSLQRRINEGLFPQGFYISGNRLGWLEREADDYACLMASEATDQDVRTWVANAKAARKRLKR
jgi:predicted DNA-binding transcriptional regulator AlpA